MLRNYLTIAWRSLKNNKGFSFINISGLAVGMAGAILIMLWIHYERSFDQFHDKVDRLYEVWNQTDFNGELRSWSYTPKPLGPILGSEYPEVAAFTRYQYPYNMLVAYGDQKLMEELTVLDPGFFTMFDFPLIKGDPSNVFSRPESLVLTEDAAKRLFGEEDPLGKVVLFDNQVSLVVSGVLANFPANTDFKFDIAVPWALYKQLGYEDDFWGNNSVKTYIELQPEVSLETASANLKGVTKKYSEEENDLILHPVSKMHLYDHYENGVLAEGKMQLVRQFFWIAVLILIIACINFMNLSTARSEKRAKEVGIRKLSGAGREKLIFQFIGESMIVAIIASAFALVFVEFLMPYFNNLMGTSFVLPFGNPIFWLLLFGFIFLTGLTAGSYPAFFLSAFVPAKVLKGKISSPRSAFSLRKILVVTQFTFAVILIAATLVIKSQIDHGQNRNAGYDREQLVYYILTEDLSRNYETFRNELLSSGAALALSRTMSPMSSTWSNTWGMSWQGKDPNQTITVERFSSDADLIQTAGLRLVEGRDIDIFHHVSDSNAVLLNQTAVEVMGFEEAIGQLIQDNGKDWNVVGVVEDFILNSPFTKVNPLVIFGPDSWYNVLHVRLNPVNAVGDNLATLETIFKKFNPSFPYQYTFVDHEYAAKFQSEERVGMLTLWFSGLAIFISCLGLFGLAAFMAEQRMKEISVRKVLGASSSRVVALLTTDFVKLVVISLIIALPVSWYFMNEWLQDFSYRIELDVWIFLGVAFITLTIAVITVSSQALKAAWSNPVDALKGE
ncbi:ABC transporter permease [Shivajiella indica]|uniref:ABC transporter permease n=1 Tax=Shivajiella indica TaxID=872115 RepID=A0ABW5B446_9BACT